MSDWHLLTSVSTSDHMAIYIDGVLVGTSLLTSGMPCITYPLSPDNPYGPGVNA